MTMNSLVSAVASSKSSVDLLDFGLAINAFIGFVSSSRD